MAAIAVVLAMAVILALLIWDRFVRWPAYREQHHCVETGETRTKTTLMCTAAGKSTLCAPRPYTSRQWRCDGGEELWR